MSASGPWSGVVIDDLFCVSCQPLGSCDPESSDSARLIARAKDAYLREGIRGSDDKDVFGADVFTIVGAECDSSPAAVKEGNVSVGAPLHKRLTLAAVTLQATASRHISLELSSMLAGGWVSVLMFRRCAMAVAGKLFELGVDSAPGEGGSALVRFPPGARQELVLLSPLLASNVAVPYEKRLFASDAKGAYTHMRPPPGVIEALWLAADSKGFYTRPVPLSPALGLSPSPPSYPWSRRTRKSPNGCRAPAAPLARGSTFFLPGRDRLPLSTTCVRPGSVAAPSLTQAPLPTSA